MAVLYLCCRNPSGTCSYRLAAAWHGNRFFTIQIFINYVELVYFLSRCLVIGKNHINEDYNQIKVYRANGEYACAEIVKDKQGNYVILPHEYGTYSLKNGMYSEMGRKAIKYEWVDKVTSRGHWFNRIDEWKKVVDMPEELTQHVVEKCKAAKTSPERIQKLIKQYIFKK